MNQSPNMPRHVAIVMDGNGRWAKQRLMPRIFGHRAGVKAVQRAIDFCQDKGIEVLSLFALSVENFQSRPESEVKFLISLLSDTLVKNLERLHRNHIRIRIMGDFSVFTPAVRTQIEEAQLLTQHNKGLTLVVAIHYSGRWDIFQAAKKFAQHVKENNMDLAQLNEADFSSFLCSTDLPEPDLFIRTSGEQRISNFMLWQIAYAELFFVDVFWPDFNDAIFAEAIATFQKRERRFGLTGEQIATKDETC
ncbi:MAG: di-trans,poly-cis-decaprenylcistransferase [Gammaproteobacteria bacterium CG_4_10_14_0_8_um_filter_38_16]|nr:MAG: di-trans,poly-cis-decaprenylcistransferase [Gammaproteobacteria bacterium CG_4_10_14_0_8_um_filter_38_16]PJA02668.1 MAG: di-trans,poly-cis-decaprenylcistransferase [Gammaproteobacteria bacterium CG_4_10_14_0_2_um_filter_38_22]PJB09864.1 MAG: di-trans,poly-cis-decaprenylcistransferase [Gammaproteobacteria bacterium CG_4_9_14_3_um_filter_38_9]